MSNTQGPDFQPTSRPRRARLEDVTNLRKEVAVLSDKLSQLAERLDQVKPDDHGLPMSREVFMAHALIATLQSGGWSHLKFADSRANEAYDKWVALCKRRQVAAAV